MCRNFRCSPIAKKDKKITKGFRRCWFGVLQTPKQLKFLGPLAGRTFGTSALESNPLQLKSININKLSISKIMLNLYTYIFYHK